MRNYCLATFGIEAWREEGTKVPECWAFFSLTDDRQEAAAMAHLLNIAPRPWLKRGHYAVCLDLVVLGCLNFQQEVRAKRWELQQLGISWTWCTDLIPEAPPESMAEAFQNTFASEEEFDIALAEPIVVFDQMTTPNGKPVQKDLVPVDLVGNRIRWI